MLMLPLSLTYSVSLTHLSVLERVVVTLYLPHSAAAATLYIKAVSSMSRGLKTSFCSVLGKEFQVSQRLCVLQWPAQQSHWLLKVSHWRCLWVPTAVWHDLRPANPLISLPKGWLVERRGKQSHSSLSCLPELAMGSMGRRDGTSPSCSLFFLCPGLQNTPAASDAIYCLSIYPLLRSNLEN